MKRAVLLLAALTVVLAGTRPVRADVVLYSTLPELPGSWYFIANVNEAAAFEFTPTANGTVSNVQLSLQFLTAGSVAVDLYTNNSNQPGTSLGMASLTAPASSTTLYTVNLTTTASLSTASDYWLAVFAETQDSLEWSVSLNGPPTNIASSFNGGATWNPGVTTSPNNGAAFAVDSPAAVPEPTSFALCGLGVAAFLGGYVWRRKQKASVGNGEALSAKEHFRLAYNRFNRLF